MAKVEVTVRGVGEINQKFQQMINRSDPDLMAAMNQAAGVVESSAKMLAPVDTGTLHGSIHIDQAKREGDSIKSGVYTSLEYAPYVEFGTGMKGGSEASKKLGITFGSQPGQVAQPYLYPALMNNRGNINRIVSEAVNRTIRG